MNPNHKTFDCTTELFEAAKLTLVRLTNATYSTKEHESLIIRSKNSPRYPIIGIVKAYECSN